MIDMLQLRKIFPQNYDVVSADFDISQSCRFSHATAQIWLWCGSQVVKAEVTLQGSSTPSMNPLLLGTLSNNYYNLYFYAVYYNNPSMNAQMIWSRFKSSRHTFKTLFKRVGEITASTKSDLDQNDDK